MTMDEDDDGLSLPTTTTMTLLMIKGNYCKKNIILGTLIGLQRVYQESVATFVINGSLYEKSMAK